MSDMRRRQFITLLGGAAAAWPVVARAQQRGPSAAHRRARDRIRGRSGGAGTRVAAFVQGLRELGWIEGRNVRIDYRWARRRRRPHCRRLRGGTGRARSRT